MAKARDTKAEYQARKARLAEQGTTLAKQRGAVAKSLGYAGLGDQRARRRAGNLTHADVAVHAKREGGKYVENLRGGRWTFAVTDRENGLDAIDRARLNQTMDRAYRADANVTITANWRHPNGRTGTAQAGGSYGVAVRGFHDEGTDAADSIEDELGAASGSELPGGAIITGLSLFFYPAAKRSEAA